MNQKKSRLSDYQRPLWLDIVHWFLKLPRLVRILLVSLFALAISLSVSPLVDYIYLRYMFNEQTRLLPSLVSATIGICIYLLGWWLVVGNVAERPPARLGILLYLMLGIFAVGLVLTLTVLGVSSATAPTL